MRSCKSDWDKSHVQMGRCLKLGVPQAYSLIKSKLVEQGIPLGWPDMQELYGIADGKEHKCDGVKAVGILINWVLLQDGRGKSTDHTNNTKGTSKNQPVFPKSRIACCLQLYIFGISSVRSRVFVAKQC